MEKIFEITKVGRKMAVSFIENHSLEQLNKIPKGCNNNIIWNIAHLINAQQALTYKMSGLPMNISDEMLDKYKKGSKPEKDLTQKEIDEIKNLLLETIIKTEEDYKNKVFTNFNEYETSSGVVLRSFEDAMNYVNFHEGLHIGYIKGISKLVIGN